MPDDEIACGDATDTRRFFFGVFKFFELLFTGSLLLQLNASFCDANDAIFCLLGMCVYVYVYTQKKIYNNKK